MTVLNFVKAVLPPMLVIWGGGGAIGFVAWRLLRWPRDN